MRPIFSMTKSGNFQLGLMMFLFCFANLLLITASQQLDGNSHLGDGNVDANSIASDLKSGNRGVFAVGYVSDKLTLFVSGPGSGNHKNPSGGFQVAVDEATDGVFKISSVPVPVPSGIPSDAGVKFVCKDSSGDNLVAMIGSSNAYLFDDSNTVYVFEASVFTSKQSAKLTKKSKEEAFEDKSAKHSNCSSSGPGSHKNPSGGFQVAVEEAADGVFKISSAPVPVPSGIPSNADVKFVCKDSSGDNLVAMMKVKLGHYYCLRKL
ncbi:hypothetical protein TYRP_011766 [Tyrophagus putrescentiae]|nr:hypothetical protein TYRP_011766 [Tyrophagus putrescentiae]